MKTPRNHDFTLILGPTGATLEEVSDRAFELFEGKEADEAYLGCTCMEIGRVLKIALTRTDVHLEDAITTACSDLAKVGLVAVGVMLDLPLHLPGVSEGQRDEPPAPKDLPHTPGRWAPLFIYRMIRRVREAPGDLMISSDPARDWADACLAAAAPNMLEVLNSFGVLACTPEWQHKKDAAIRKAKG